MNKRIQLMREFYFKGQYEEALQVMAQQIDFEALTIEEKAAFYRVQIGIQIAYDQQIDERHFLEYKRLMNHVDDVVEIVTFENIEGLKYAYEKNFEKAIATFKGIIADERSVVEWNPELYSAALGNCIFAYSNLTQYKEAVLLYNSISEEKLERVLLTAPRTYFHVYENLLDAYIGMGQWHTGIEIAKAVLAQPEIEDHPRYKYLILMAYGYLVAQVDIQKGTEICLEAAAYFDFEKQRVDYKLAYKRLMAVLKQNGDETLQQQFEIIHHV